MAKVAVLDDRKTGKLNSSWKADSEKLDNCKFIISEKTGKVYQQDGVKETDEGRVNFKHLTPASPEIQEKYAGFVENHSRKQGEQNPVRYFDTLQ